MSSLRTFYHSRVLEQSCACGKGPGSHCFLQGDGDDILGMLQEPSWVFELGRISPPHPPPLTSEHSQLRSAHLVGKRLHSRSAIQTVYSSTTPGSHGSAVNEHQMQERRARSDDSPGPASPAAKLLLLLPVLLQASRFIVTKSAQ